MVTQLIGGRNIIQAEVTQVPDPKVLTPGIPLLLLPVAHVQNGGGGGAGWRGEFGTEGKGSITGAMNSENLNEGVTNSHLGFCKDNLGYC